MKNRAKWVIKQDRYEEDEEKHSYTITLNPEWDGWTTDSGCESYGLPKKLAQWICDILNESGKEPPFLMTAGFWYDPNRIMTDEDFLYEE